ncbi:hypothetical protein WAI453_008911 [Rhynchosporium graminicola]|uniref:Related to pisatin demethylase / cytochrome P450 monooxygenase n=1 Tax=Rhynchosporium graminicola TaxID=2792576 RepID=A0A1E1LPP9_9HELO|nr:related to pisatin demethylase / cytochrome P450 monooxygenase [Rhynchosporium commune]
MSSSFHLTQFLDSPNLSPNLLSFSISLATFATVYGVYYGLFHPLHKFPGPFLAKFCDLWRFRSAATGTSHLKAIELHQKYGPIVRIGPTTLSFAAPSYIPKIYGPGRGFHKSAFYNPFQGKVQNTIGYNLFTSRDHQFHVSIKQPVAAAYGRANMIEYEPIVDSCIVKFVQRLIEEFDTKERVPCDLGSWFQYFAFDAIAEMTMGQSLGFLDQGIDVNNMIHTLDARLDRIAPRSQMPWVDWLFEKNPLVSLFKPKSSGFFIFASRLVKERADELKILEKEGKRSGASLFIDRFLEAKKKYPDTVDDRTVGIYTTSNIMAGSDTIAIVLRTIVYMVLRHPDVQKKLLEELDSSELSSPVTWEESQKLPYTAAVVQEALRIHPPVGFGIERDVPPSGLLLDDGTIIPQGVQVSMNAWVLHQDPIFEADPTAFKPERWLKRDDESESDHKERIAAMERAWLPFGYGSRACMGKHISYLEMNKLVPTMFRELEFELCGGVDKEWKTRNSWFVRQWDMDCYIKKR